MGITNNIPPSRLIQSGVCTSATRPVSPYVGQGIYETDTLLTKYWDGASWALVNTGYVICTSTTRPASPYAGQEIYETNTNMLAIWNGTAWRYFASTTSTNGSVLQIVTGTSVTQTSTGSATYSDVGLSASITPKATTSKVLVFAQINYYNLSTNKTTFNLVRGTTQINETNPLGGDAANIDGGHFLTFLDSPATLSATTYKVQFKTSGSAAYFRASASATCTIYLVEIAG